MRVLAAVISGAILLGCGGARDSGGGTAATSSQVTTTPPAAPSASAGATPPSTDTPQSTPASPPDTTPAPPPPPSPPPPAATPQAWAGTQVFTTPWTELEGVATLPGGRLIVFGSQFITRDGIGSRHGTLAWTDATGKVERVEAPQADEIFGMAVSTSSRAIALAGYTQGTGGYLLVLDEDGAQQWLVSMGREVAVYGVPFPPTGDQVARGSDPDSFIGRWAPDGALLWRQT